MSSTEQTVCPTFHVEQLNEDRVWDALRRSLEHLEKHGGRATAFVATRRARQAGQDVAPRLQWLADQGHEIAMHTHFRASVPPGETVPRSELKSHAPLTDQDIVASLDADYTYLADRGHVPRGFCAGTWSIYPTAAEWLRSHDFQYDCSRRSYRLDRDNPPLPVGDERGPLFVKGTLEIPTTATLRAMISTATARRYPSLPYDNGRYTLFYLHDYDLLQRGKQVAFRLLARRLRGSSVVPVRDIARAISAGNA